jgi:23S rRNA pseudouridine2605 synthase
MVNGRTVSELGMKIDPEKDIVLADGERVKPQKKVYFLLNKPKGVVTTTKDEKGRPTVLDLVNVSQSIFPVGRLDFNTTGALLLTNDGDFAEKLIHPRNKFERVYLVVLDKPLQNEHKEKMLKGIFLEKGRSRFEKVEFLKKKDKKRVRVFTTEGKYHFVKRMFAKFGYNVKQLHRERIGFFSVENLPEGKFRKLTPKEIETILRK